MLVLNPLLNFPQKHKASKLITKWNPTYFITELSFWTCTIIFFLNWQKHEIWLKRHHLVSLKKCSNRNKYIKINALRKAEYSDFCIFAKFETCNIPYILYIQNISRQNWILSFEKYLFRLEYLIASSECRALIKIKIKVNLPLVYLKHFFWNHGCALYSTPVFLNLFWNQRHP